MKEDKKEEKVDLSQLSDLDFAPNWNNGFNAEKKYKNKIEPKRQERKKEFKSRKKELPRRYDSPFTNRFKITISPDIKILDTLKKGIRKSGISYSLEEIHTTIVDKKNRLVISIEKLNEQETFFVTTFDNSIFDTKLSAITHIIEKGLEHVVDITETIGENPSGNFKNILRCKLTEKLLPPKSFHDFEAIIKTHLVENKIKTSYSKFIADLQIIEDDLTINEWKNKPLKKLIYKTKDHNNRRTFNKLEAVHGFISSKESSEFIKTNRVIKIKGDSIDKLEKKLGEFISDFLKNSYQWKKDLFFSILINFKKSGFHIFKYGPNNYLFATGIKPKSIEITKISKNCLKIVKFIQSKNTVKIVNVLSQSEEMELMKSQILIELKWLVREGYVREFSNGTIEC